MNKATLSLFLLIGQICVLAAASTSEDEIKFKPLTSDPTRDWDHIKDGLQNDKDAMCNYLLVQVSKPSEGFTLEGVKELFIQSLDHLGKTTSYMDIFASQVDKKVVDEYDLSGSQLVLEISDNVRNLLADYRKAEANKADEERKQHILRQYFYQACANKLATVMAESSMYKYMLKLRRRQHRRETTSLAHQY